MSEGIPYKNYVIEPCSEEALTEDFKPIGWLPKVVVNRHDPGGVHTQPLTWYKPFPTREEADQAAIRMAKQWIDKQEGR